MYPPFLRFNALPLLHNQTSLMLGSMSTLLFSTPTPKFSNTTPNPLHYSSSFPKANITAMTPLSTFSHHLNLFTNNATPSHFPVKLSASSSSASVGAAEFTEEPATKVKFQKSLSLPGCSSALSLLGTGYREKVFAIIGVKVYAAGLYLNPSILSTLSAWKGQPAAEIQTNSAIFSSIFQASSEKSLQIVLVRDIEGKTFWDALDEAISPRITSPTPVDESALSTFRSIFQGRPLKKGTFIFLTWLDPFKMQVSVSSDGLPSGVDATMESSNVTSALYDVFFGNSSVSPSLKTSVSDGLATVLK